MVMCADQNLSWKIELTKFSWILRLKQITQSDQEEQI